MNIDVNVSIYKVMMGAFLSVAVILLFVLIVVFMCIRVLHRRQSKRHYIVTSMVKFDEPVVLRCTHYIAVSGRYILMITNISW